jgi:hypothetical protein
MRFNLVADKVQRFTHLDAQRLSLVTAHDGAAIVVGQNDHWHVFQARVKDPLCADIEICAVADRDRPRHARSYRRTTPAITPQISLSSFSSMSGKVSRVLAGAR